MANWRKELREISNKDPEPGEELHAVNAALDGSESDRGCALIAGAITENAVQQILRMHAFQVQNKDLPSLFNFESPLGTFGDKIKIAHAFGAIDTEIRDDLDRIREIRNAFAHSTVAITFSTPAVIRGCAGFIAPYPKELGPYMEGVSQASVLNQRFVE
jgi:hypothetical protein